MPSYRFYITDLTPSIVALDEQESQHARKVMRVAVGDAVELFDGVGGLATGCVSQIGRRVEIEVQHRHRAERSQPVIDLAVALPKGDRAAMLVEKAAELGADRLIPLITRRSVVEPGEGKIERFGRITVEAAKQCGRAWLMQIAPTAPFEQLVKASDHDKKLIADTGAAMGMTPMTGEPPGKILVLIGPEGGWTQDERQLAARHGFVPWCLGPYVMRIETAAIAAVAILRQST